MVTLGVVADTHVPDRVRRLNPQVLAIFQAAGVDAILHAGDISIPTVLRQLEEVAPVYAARGNRDVFRLRNLPSTHWLEYEGIRLVLTHGQGPVWRYLAEKALYFFEEYRPERWQPPLLADFPHAQVIVFGHTHRPMNQWVSGKLLFNPGSPHELDPRKITPSLGLLSIQAGGKIEGKIVELK